MYEKDELNNLDQNALKNLIESDHSDAFARAVSAEVLYKDKAPKQYSSGILSGVGKVLSFLPKGVGVAVTKWLYNIFDVNSKAMGKYITKGEHVLKFPLLVTENIDRNLVAKFCALLQTEKAEYVRKFFYNNKLVLTQDESQLAKQFSSRFYEDIEYVTNIFNSKECTDIERLNILEDALCETVNDLVDLYEYVYKQYKDNNVSSISESEVDDAISYYIEFLQEAKNYNNDNDTYDQRERHHRETLDQRERQYNDTRDQRERHHRETFDQRKEQHYNDLKQRAAHLKKEQEWKTKEAENARKHESRENALSRLFTRRENEKRLKHDAEEARKQREHDAEESRKQREHDAEQKDKDRKAHSEENEKQRNHDATQKDKDRELNKELQKSQLSSQEKMHKASLDQQERQFEKDMAFKIKQAKEQSRKDYQKARTDEFSINSASGDGNLWGDKLSIQKSDLHPINPTNINVQVHRYGFSDVYTHQILAVRYIPHVIPFNEFIIGFKYGILNSRLIMRFLKLLSGEIGVFNFLTKSDARALNMALTKISTDKKSWNLGLKDSTQAVTVIMTKQEFDFLCDTVVDIKKPEKFKHFQKDVGMLDLIVVDKDSKDFIRINAIDNYQMVHYDIRDVLNANTKDLVINARIDQNSLRDEDF